MIEKIIKNSIEIKKLLLENKEIHKTILSVVDIICETFQNGNRVMFCGNGGSAADAQHLAAELSGRFYKDRKALPSDALHCNTSYLTAVANDYDYDSIYSRLVDGTMNVGDVLIGISTSGNSTNIVKAFEVANQKNITTIGLTGIDGGKLNSTSDYILKVPSTDTPRIQESHILLGHIICELVESKLFKYE
jgi:D-sedoheptulose 7-phosphate isomerase